MVRSMGVGSGRGQLHVLSIVGQIGREHRITVDLIPDSGFQILVSGFKISDSGS